jgi:hypothetical protein
MRFEAVTISLRLMQRREYTGSVENGCMELKENFISLLPPAIDFSLFTFWYCKKKEIFVGEIFNRSLFSFRKEYKEKAYIRLFWLWHFNF